MIVVMMGVTGTGKSTIGGALRDRTGWEFAEGDDYHSEANREKMRGGVPLTDGDREPWLETLHGVIAGWAAAGKNGILTCSALKESYRETLRHDLPEGTVRFVLLEAPKQVLEDRLEHRKGHFMNPALLNSQLATLEVPEYCLHIPVTSTAEECVDEILAGLHVQGS